MSEREIPFTYLEDDLIILKKNKNKNTNKLKSEYSSKTAEKMNTSEILELINQ